VLKNKELFASWNLPLGHTLYCFSNEMGHYSNCPLFCNNSLESSSLLQPILFEFSFHWVVHRFHWVEHQHSPIKWDTVHLLCATTWNQVLFCTTYCSSSLFTGLRIRFFAPPLMCTTLSAAHRQHLRYPYSHARYSTIVGERLAIAYRLLNQRCTANVLVTNNY
jgi:hypothetical protein